MATIFGTSGADALRGTASADAIYGFWGDDSISGGDGRDFLYGGQGNDTFDGGAGQDYVDGGDGLDTALYASNTTSVWADLRTGVVTFPGQTWPAETLLNIEAVEGGSGRDTFIGNGAANIFRGGWGGDTLLGNIGADTIYGDGGNDSLDGGNGGDVLDGGAGTDTVRGGIGDDLILTGDAGTFDGGGGTDTLAITGLGLVPTGEDFVWGDPAVRANLGTGLLRVSADLGSLVGIENIETGVGDDAVNGSSASNFISVGDGVNIVYAGAGDDTIIGGIYRPEGGSTGDLLNGGAGNDYIDGRGQAEIYSDGWAAIARDTLIGGAGDDTIRSGAAIVTISGGEGRDTFIFDDSVYMDSGTTPAQVAISDYEQGEVFRLETIDPIDPDQISFARDGADTVVTIEIANADVPLSITLLGYSGALPDFVLV